jgi:6-phosphogluconolactonase
MSIPSLRQLFASGYAAADQPGIHAFTLDDATGALSHVGSFVGVTNPSFIVIHPNGRWLYAVSEGGSGGSVWSARLDSMTLQLLNHQSSGGNGPCHLCFDATGKWLFVANYGSGSAGVLPIQDDGSLGEMTGHVQHHGSSGVNAKRQEGPHAHSSTMTPDNRFVIVADLGLDKLMVYAFDAQRGTLTAHAEVATRPGAGPRHLAFHPNGQQVYVANELDSTVAVYDYDAANGAFHEAQVLSTLPADVPGNTVADIHIDEAGKRLYVSNRGHDSLAVFDVAQDGRLTPVNIRPCGGAWPRNFALAPGGKFVVVANQYSDGIAVLPLTNDDQAVGEPVARGAATGASCVQFLQS